MNDNQNNNEEETAPEESEQSVLEGKVASLEVELVEAKDKMMRAMAEAENARRRAAKDKVEASAYSISSFAKDLLGVADTLTRAIAAGDENDPTIKGVMATAAMLQMVMERHGVKRIEAEGKLFDPQFHEILMETQGGKAGYISQVMEEGYTLNGRLLRPARVCVFASSGVEDSAPSGSNIDEEA